MESDHPDSPSPDHPDTEFVENFYNYYKQLKGKVHSDDPRSPAIMLLLGEAEHAVRCVLKLRHNQTASSNPLPEEWAAMVCRVMDIPRNSLSNPHLWLETLVEKSGENGRLVQLIMDTRGDYATFLLYCEEEGFL